MRGPTCIFWANLTSFLLQLEQQAKASAEMMAQQDLEMALLTKEFKALGSKADSEAAAPADKKSSACVLQ